MAFGLTVGCAAQDPSPRTDEPSTSVGESDQDIGGGGGGDSDCTGHTVCYCQCRVSHQCGVDPSQCAPQGACLTRCDQLYPTCSGEDPGPRNPTRPSDCII